MTPALAALALLLSGAPAPATEKTSGYAAFDAYAARVLREFEVPGVAVAVVKEGRVVLAKGYGVRQKGNTAPVTADTAFGIASNTKLFTAAGLGLLAEDGKLAWNDAVATHLPDFQMFDPYVSKEMTIRDLVSHRSGLGLGQGDLLYFPPSDLTRPEIVRRARFLKPQSSFRSRYAYSNLMFITAGQVIAAVSGQSFDDFITGRLLGPLGMTASNTSPTSFAAGADVATPHARVDGSVTAVDWEKLDNIAAAGGINSTANDMSRWLRALLEAAAGRTVGPLKKSLVDALWTAEMPVPIPPPTAGLEVLQPHFLAYARGTSLRDYRGRLVIGHTGGLRGMVSRVMLVPEEQLGVVVLTNQESDEARDALAYRLLDLGLQAPPTDWLAAFKRSADVDAAKEKAAEQAQQEARAGDSKPSLPLPRYAGRYRDAWYGDVALDESEGKLVLRFSHTPSLVADLVHWQYDTFVARWRDRTVPDAFVSFALRPDASIEQIRMRAVSPDADFSYDYQDLLLIPLASPTVAPR